jgi:hypothetical protein
MAMLSSAKEQVRWLQAEIFASDSITQKSSTSSSNCNMNGASIDLLLITLCSSWDGRLIDE